MAERTMTEPQVGRRCLYPGSFDPVTVGHADVVRRAAAVFDSVVVAVLENPDKSSRFSVSQRVAWLEAEFADLSAVSVIHRAGALVVEVSRDIAADVLVRGIRGAADLEREWSMAAMNRHLTGIETVFIPGDPRHAHISSSLVRQVIDHGRDPAGLVPYEVRRSLQDKPA
ncbi:MAG: pantetheine-phosphate adenylyltransferase [Actinomycetota bacterium]